MTIQSDPLLPRCSASSPHPRKAAPVPRRRPRLTAWLLALAIGHLGLLTETGQAQAEPTASDIAALRDFKPEGGDISALVRKVAPGLATEWLALPPGAVIDKGAPLETTLGPQMMGQLDASGTGLPIVLYHKEDGRLPGAFIVARYRGVTPLQLLYRLAERSASLKHPLMDQFTEATPWSKLADSAWGIGANVRRLTAMLAFRMPFGAGLFGLRDSFALGEWQTVMLPNGVGVLTFQSRAATPEEKTRFATFRDKKDKERKLDSDYYEAREYRLSSLLIPEKDATGLFNTVHVYFVRIVPNLKPGKDLSGSGALAQWLFKRGSQEAILTPVQMIRTEVERARSGK